MVSESDPNWKWVSSCPPSTIALWPKTLGLKTRLRRVYGEYICNWISNFLSRLNGPMTGQNENFKTLQDSLIEALPAMSSSSDSSSSSDEDEERVRVVNWWNSGRCGNQDGYLVVAGTSGCPQEVAWLSGGWGYLFGEIWCPSSKMFSLMPLSLNHVPIVYTWCIYSVAMYFI